MGDAANVPQHLPSNVMEVTRMDGTYLDTTTLARNALDAARQQHMLALQAAIAAGLPNGELLEDCAGFSLAAGQLLRLCGVSGGPMHLTSARVG